MATLLPAAGRLSLLAEPSFVAVWAAGASMSTMRWLEMLAVGVFVFDVTGSPFVVAVMTILRMLPLALFGVVGGALSERFNRQLLLLIGLAGQVALSCLLGYLAGTGAIETWHIGAGSFLNGMLWALELTARRMIIGEIAGPDRVGAAMSLDTMSNNGTRMLGPLIGGVLLETFGLEGTYFLGSTLYGLSFVAIASLPHGAHRGRPADLRVLHSVLEGLRYLRRDRVLTGILVVTIIFNTFAFPFVSMIPVIGKEVLGLGASMVGIVASAEGAGAVVGAMLVAMLGNLPRFRLIYVGGLAGYMLAALLFARSTDAALSSVLLALVGMSVAGFSAMQSTLVLLNTPPEVRGRMMGVLTVCIGSGPIGFFHLGLLAGWVGAAAAVTIMTVEGLVLLAVAVRMWPEVLHRQERPRA